VPSAIQEKRGSSGGGVRKGKKPVIELTPEERAMFEKMGNGFVTVKRDEYHYKYFFTIVYNTIEYNTIYTMSLIESVFELDDNVSFNTNRKKQDILKVSPVSGTVWGSSGVKAFEINNQQHYLLFSEAYLYGEVELRLTGGDDKITLENNWFPRCFSHMILRIGGKEIEGIHNAVGEASTLSNFVMTSNAFRNAHGQIAGWVPDTMKGDQDRTDVDANMGYFWRMKVYNQKKKFSFIFPLKYLFGFCTDYNKILYLIKIRLELNLKPDSEISPEVFYGDAGTTGKINSIE
jgi:hypothetical protein